MQASHDSEVSLSFPMMSSLLAAAQAEVLTLSFHVPSADVPSVPCRISQQGDRLFAHRLNSHMPGCPTDRSITSGSSYMLRNPNDGEGDSGPAAVSVTPP